MTKCNSNRYLIIANLSAMIYFFIGHFVNLPDIVRGFCLGVCIALYPIGLYALNHDISKLQSFKTKLINRFAK